MQYISDVCAKHPKQEDAIFGAIIHCVSCNQLRRQLSASGVISVCFLHASHQLAPLAMTTQPVTCRGERIIDIPTSGPILDSF